MPQINAGDFRKGLKVIVEGQPYEMFECNFVKPGKGQALYKTKLRNLLTGTILDITYRSGESLEQADVRNTDGMYSYYDGSNYVFMDNDSFEQVSLSADICGDQMRFIKDGTACGLMYWNDQLIGVTPPQHVVLEVTFTEPAAKGNTATNVTKPATVETGAEVKVPAFISTGEKIKIAAETGEYLGRA
ncbi:MAG: elongation factor P [Planctomycetota bacterium]|nr:MAG: elongation factor P [Planctomycetota bacterium]REJ93369.1 MAG: elongation factor P [Planctomycetota bacterium]REK20746.1 MAG: elongation factor P [Planctomycetota bacterium]REK38072.1 MAG: elongation factor P [Planctomycetota bacterium]